MCGQYSFLASKKALLERYQIDLAANDSLDLDEQLDLESETNNIYYPKGKHPILLPNHKIYAIQWGLTPSFAKRPLINARLETVLEKQTFQEAFMKKRCLVPATCFYEWQAASSPTDSKSKYKIAVKDLPIFSMAGICERYSDGKGGSFLTYAILTTEPSPEMASIHDRMPVILKPELEATYLDLTYSPQKLQAQLSQGTPSELLIELCP